MMRLTIFIFLLLICQCCFSQHWQSLGQGIWPSAATYIYADSVSNKLYVAGQFREVDGNYQRGIGSWDATGWSAMGDGIDSCVTCGSMPNVTRAMISYNSQLYICGGFTWVGDVNAKYLARWNGFMWDTIPGGQPNNPVGDVRVFNNELYACGWFDSIGNIRTGCIAKWDGAAWNAVGNYDFIATGRITQMEFYHGNLYVGGLFQDPQGITCRLAKWDGNSWQFMTSSLVGGIADVWDFAVYNNELYISGLFYQGAGNVANSIMRWNDTIMRDVGGSVEFYYHNVPQVRQMLVHNGKLYCAGNFEIIGGVFAFGLASWDGTNWCGYNTSFTASSQECGTFSLAFYDDTLYMAGGFVMADGDSLAGIGKWISGNFVDTCGNTTTISEHNSLTSQVSVYPNPSSSTTTFQFSSSASRTITVTDNLGRVIWRRETSDALVEFPAYEFPNGMYFYRVDGKNSQGASGKFVIQR